MKTAVLAAAFTAAALGAGAGDLEFQYSVDRAAAEARLKGFEAGRQVEVKVPDGTFLYIVAEDRQGRPRVAYAAEARDSEKGRVYYLGDDTQDQVVLVVSRRALPELQQALASGGLGALARIDARGRGGDESYVRQTKDQTVSIRYKGAGAPALVESVPVSGSVR